MVTKIYFCLLNWGIWVTSIWHKALDLRPQGLVSIVCKAGVVIRDAHRQEECYPLELSKGDMREVGMKFLYICVCGARMELFCLLSRGYDCSC